MTNEPSPRPWMVDDSSAHERFGRKFVRIRDANGQSITVGGNGRLFAEDAALIVDAVNAIEETKKLSIKLYDPIRRAEAERDKLLASMKAIEDLCKVLDRTDLWEDREEWLDDAIYYIRKEARAAIKENEE